MYRISIDDHEEDKNLLKREEYWMKIAFADEKRKIVEEKMAKLWKSTISPFQQAAFRA